MKGAAPRDDRERLIYWSIVAFSFIVYVGSGPVVVPDPNDDTFIFLRVVENILNGKGPVYNPGERVEVFSSPLWVALLSLFGFAMRIVEPNALLVDIAQWSSTFFVLTAASLTARLTSRRTSQWWGLGAGILFLILPQSLVWARSGMDAALCCTLLVAFWLLCERETPHPETTHERLVEQIALGIGMLLVWSRPEGWLWALGCLLLGPRRWKPWKCAWFFPRTACVLGALAILLSCRYLYFGAWLPNTYFAKRGSGAEFWAHGLSYVTSNLKGMGLFPVPLWLLSVVLPQGRHAAWGPLLLCFGQLLVVVAEGGDFLWFGRLLYPLLPFCISLAFAGAFSLKSLSPRLGSGLGAMALLLWLVPTTQALWSGDLPERADAVRKKHRSTAATARFFRKVLLADETLAIGPAGAFVYEAKPRAAWDFYGLLTPDVARSEPVPGRPGHQRFRPRLILGRHPDFLVLENYFQKRLPCQQTRTPRGPPSLRDEVLKEAKLAGYVEVSAQTEAGTWFVFVASSEALERRRPIRLHAVEACN